jgi:hypothetical protein
MNWKKIDLSTISGEAEKKFQTYLNYLRQFNQYIEQEYGSGPDLARITWKNLSKIQGTKEYDKKYLEKSLRLAWNTETIACSFGLGEPEALRVNNHWKPIQTYYAIYSLSEAVSHLLTLKTRFSHKSALKCVSEFYSKANIYPWGFGFEGKIGRDRKQAKPVNIPKDVELAHNLQIRDVSPVNILATCLSAEHNKRVHDVYEERKSKKKKGQKIPYKYETDPGLTTLFHFVYRLRLRSNYHSAEMFHSNVTDTEVCEFDGYLNQFCARTMCILEVLIIRKIGKKQFLKIYDSFDSKVKYNKQLESRISVYHGLR